MYWRLFVFFLFQVLAAILGWLFPVFHSEVITAVCASLVASYVWFLIDTLRGARLVRWLRKDDFSNPAFEAGFWGDVSDRIRRLMRARDRLAIESEGRLQDILAALQASPNGVVLLDSEWRIEWFNQTAADHFGFDARRDMLQHLGNLVREPVLASYLAAHDFLHDVVVPGRRSTASNPIKLSVHIHSYGEGRSLLLSRDITALEQAEAMRRDFVANVSHEIRTPLTVLGGFVETLQSLPLNEQEREKYLALMAQQADRMQTLVTDLLTLSRLEGSPLPPTQEWVTLSTLLEQCEHDARALSGLLWKDPQTISFDVEEGCQVSGTATELHSALSNLISNAVRYTQGDRSITVTWKRRAEGGALFCVEDTGLGIAPEHIARLTERFYRVDRSRSRDTGGTGLGLAIVKHVVQRHGAELTISSELGKGSRFAIAFPEHRVRDLMSA
ncbi:phosphate regulon sensor histidine kinase PhoR [Rhodoferax aquaticus]|uniref:Phosphate regulon sensor protein PhoR n=1 Tax=Rhodoferax aquaticus TaxID=2527691 RepID=A0A515ENV9_9BURK|nr:phosphate regulon sensor histidine kinase PhoR [Rhodoferax aquaticus]QDL54349.1 phosphate regulon sensor histidine kinase PhoR [Rhodoferax aquaticus]